MVFGRNSTMELLLLLLTLLWREATCGSPSVQIGERCTSFTASPVSASRQPFLSRSRHHGAYPVFSSFCFIYDLLSTVLFCKGSVPHLDLFMSLRVHADIRHWYLAWCAGLISDIFSEPDMLGSFSCLLIMTKYDIGFLLHVHF